MIGKTISHSKILEKLGEGGMGVVYKAEDTKLKRYVAIKFLPQQIAASEEERARFRIEAQAAAALNHPNIATIHNIEEVDDELFIVMEYIEGQELKSSINNNQLSIDNILDYATQIAFGLQAAHEKDIIHRDIKSSNSMITGDGQVKIMDFGLAKVRGGSGFTKVGTIVGTIAYMSPEQAHGIETDQRTDIWSFGVVLYEMLTGQLPFDGEYEQAIIYSILHEEPQSASSLRGDVPDWLEAIVNKTLAKDLDDRYSEMKEVLTDLQGLPGKTAGTTLPKSTRSESKASIGVLPFTNLSGSPDQDYFCDGMADEIINALSRLENLHVAARTSSFFFKGQNIDINEIGQKLKVAHVLEGSVRIAGDRLRINVQLITAADGYPLWSERFDRKMDDVFAIQDEISLAIVDKLKVSLLATEKAALLKRYTENVEAYNLYLKGSFYLQLLDPKGFNLAIDCFQKVLNLDPAYAPAYIGLGSVNALRIFFEDDFSPHDVMPHAKIYAQKALQIDNDLAEAHALLARIYSQYEWNWEAAEQAYQTALELNPNYALGHAWYALHLSSVGRHEEAMPFAKRAAELDPLSSYIKAMLADRLVMHRQFDAAIETASEVITLNPNNGMAYSDLGIAYESKSMLDEAIAAYEKAVTLSGEHVIFNFCSACFYHQTGDLERATKLFEKLKAIPKQKYAHPMQRFFIYRAQGEFDQAYHWLARAVEEHDPLLLYFNEYPVAWARIPDEPRFRALVEKVGLMPNPS